MDGSSFFDVNKFIASLRKLLSIALLSSSTPLSRFMTDFFVSESASLYSSTSFFSVAVTVIVFLDAEEDEEDVFFFPDVEDVDDEEAEEEGFPDPVPPLGAFRRELCVTPVAFAIWRSWVEVSSFSPRSAFEISEAVQLSTFCAASASE